MNLMHRLIFILLFIQSPATAQQLSVAATAVGTSQSFVADPHPQGMPINQAGLIHVAGSFVETTVLNKYSIKELTTVSAGGAIKFNSDNAISIVIAKTGNNSFTEQFVEGGVSKKLTQKLSAGIRLTYYQWNLSGDNYSDSRTWIPELSLLLNALPKIHLGAIIRNPSRSRMNSFEEKPLPATIQSGVTTTLSDKIKLSVSALSSTESDLSYNAGFEYNYSKELIVRTGINSLPLTQSFGFQLTLSKYSLSAAIQNNPNLGISSSVSFLFRL